MSESSSDQDIVDYIDLFRRLVINSPLQISDFVPYHAKHDPTRTCLLATVHDEDACTIWSLMWVPEGLYVYYNWDDNEDENEDVQCECCMVMQWKVRKPIQVSVFEGVTIQPTDVVVFKSMQPALGVRYETCPTLLLEPHEPVLVDDFDVLSNATYRQVFGSYLENNMVAENPVRRLFILWRDFKRTYYEDFDEDFKRKRPPLRRVDRRVPLPLLPTPVAPPRAPVSDLEVRAMIDEIAAELDM